MVANLRHHAARSGLKYQIFSWNSGFISGVLVVPRDPTAHCWLVGARASGHPNLSVTSSRRLRCEIMCSYSRHLRFSSPVAVLPVPRRLVANSQRPAESNYPVDAGWSDDATGESRRSESACETKCKSAPNTAERKIATTTATVIAGE